MASVVRCPTCAAPLSDANPRRCVNGHDFDPIALALATNRATVQALWLAVDALEADAEALRHLAASPVGKFAEVRRQEAELSQRAATRLRDHALAAQWRLEALAADTGEGSGEVRSAVEGGPDDCYVVEHPNGWAVVKDYRKPPGFLFPTEKEAVAAARRIIRDGGGGKLVVCGPDGVAGRTEDVEAG